MLLGRQACFSKVAGQAFLQILGFTDINNPVLFIDHAVDTGFAIDRGEKGFVVECWLVTHRKIRLMR
jgi:hypothetical protein